MATVKLFLSQPYKHPTNITTKKSTKRVDKTLSLKETRIYIAVIIDRLRVIKIRTPYVILPKEWDFKKQGKRDTLAGSIEYNSKLQELRKDMLSKYDEIIKEHPDWSLSAVANELKIFGKTKGKPQNDNNADFFQILEKFITYLDGEVAPGTIKKFNTLKKSLRTFETTNPSFRNLTFSMIDHKFKDSYTYYLRNQTPRGRQKSRPKGEQKGLLNDTIGKYIECLKTFCKWAEERGYNKYSVYNQFSNFTKANKKRKKQDNDIVTLTLPELKKFYSFDFSQKPHLDRVRDLFCFGVYTGQRWSDIERLDKRDISGDVWSFTAYKTKKQTEIDLLGFAAPALDILKKYDYRLPKISLTKFNLYIKDAAKEAGLTSETKIVRYVGAKEVIISKPKYRFIGSHTARKTCVSILLNDYNLNVTHVLEITGHSDLKTLQKYINKDREARRKALSNTISVTELLTVKRNKAV
jgi:integrase